jgi:hypothetical protein
LLEIRPTTALQIVAPAPRKRIKPKTEGESAKNQIAMTVSQQWTGTIHRIESHFAARVPGEHR